MTAVKKLIITPFLLAALAARELQYWSSDWFLRLAITVGDLAGCLAGSTGSHTYHIV